MNVPARCPPGMKRERRLARFWAIVNKSAPAPAHRPELGPCWLYEAPGNDFGYVSVSLFGRSVHVHRASWEMASGPIPPGALVCHHCDVPNCVNPAHLFLGTPLSNMRDRDAKGRHRAAHGELNGNAKIGAADVIAIRERAARGERQRALGIEYRLSEAQIHRIVKGKRWQTVK